MRTIATFILAATLFACSGDPETTSDPEVETQESAVSFAGIGDEDLALTVGRFYFIRDDAGNVLETVIVAHNSSRACPGGCRRADLGDPTTGDELGILKAVFDGDVVTGQHAQGSALVQASIKLGTHGCGEPAPIDDPQGGVKPGMARFEASSATVDVERIDASTGAIEKITGEVSAAFDNGTVSGTFTATHCAALDTVVVE